MRPNLKPIFDPTIIRASGARTADWTELTRNRAGEWLLVVGPHSIRHILTAVIAALGGHGPVRVLDAGNQFDGYGVARRLHGQPEALKQITVARAFSCYQVLTLLEQTPATATPFIVLDLLASFYDESVWVGERKRLLRICLGHLDRLERSAGGLVSVSPPKVASQEALELFQIVEAAACGTYRVQVPAPPPHTPRLL